MDVTIQLGAANGQLSGHHVWQNDIAGPGELPESGEGIMVAAVSH